MDRDPVAQILERLDRPVEPPAKFAESLLSRLIAELEAERVAGVPSPLRRPWLPRLSLAAAGLALAAVVSIVVSVFLLASSPPSALAVVQEAQQAFAQVPPFRATVSGRSSAVAEEMAPGTDIQHRFVQVVSYGGEAGWRRDILEDEPPARGGAGSFTVWDGRQLGVYSAEANEFSVNPDAAAEASPQADLSPALSRIQEMINWFGPASQPGSFETYLEENCNVLADDRIAGRPAQHVSCTRADHPFEIWFDGEFGLVLRFVSGATESESSEVTSIEYNPVFPPGIFEFVPPPGARDFEELIEDAYSQVDLVQGEVAPSWSGPLVGGGTLHLEDLRGRPVLIFFWADWCDLACFSSFPDFQEASQQWADRVAFVSVDFFGSAEEAEKIMQNGGYTFPVVVDSSGAVGEAWGLESVPIWVLLDADGRVVEIRLGPQALVELNELLARASE